MKDPEHAIVLSRNNRGQIKDGTPCGCYFCTTISKGYEITEWCDDGQTALCPHCDIDSVIPNETDVDYLKASFERWFTGIVDE